MIYLAILSFGAMFGIVGLSVLLDILDNRKNNSWQKRVTADDLKELGRLLKD